MRPVRDSKLSGLRRRNARAAVTTRGRSAPGKRARGTQRVEQLPYSPPEDWHEPSECAVQGPANYRILVQEPGKGYRHVVTPRDIRVRLSQLPAEFVAPLEVIQLSRMTRKKERFACYGMQWGMALYLYPLEADLVERYHRPPKPAQVQEARMYGGRWVQVSPRGWNLVWTEAAARNFYLNNVLVHELGHLLDERNSSYTDRERYAEWFALEHGYKSTRHAHGPTRRRPVRRRHHCC